MPGIHHTTSIRMRNFAEQNPHSAKSIRCGSNDPYSDRQGGFLDLGPAMACTGRLSPYHDGPRCHLYRTSERGHIFSIRAGLKREETHAGDRRLQDLYHDRDNDHARTARMDDRKSDGRPPRHKTVLRAVQQREVGAARDQTVPDVVCMMGSRSCVSDDWVGGPILCLGAHWHLANDRPSGRVHLNAFLCVAPSDGFRHFLRRQPRMKNMPMLLALGRHLAQSKICDYAHGAGCCRMNQRLGSCARTICNKLEMEIQKRQIHPHGRHECALNTGPAVPSGGQPAPMGTRILIN